MTKARGVGLRREMRYICAACRALEHSRQQIGKPYVPYRFTAVQSEFIDMHPGERVMHFTCIDCVATWSLIEEADHARWELEP